MSKIASLYVPLLKEFKIRTLDDFVDRFYQRMSRERFESILRGYRIAPCQHREKFVIQALEQVSTSRNETRISQPSEVPSYSVSSTHERTIPEPSTTHMSAGQVQGIRDTILSIDLMLKTDIADEKRQRILLRKKSLENRISSFSIPESSEEATILVDEESKPLPLP